MQAVAFSRGGGCDTVVMASLKKQLEKSVPTSEMLAGELQALLAFFLRRNCAAQHSLVSLECKSSRFQTSIFIAVSH